MSLNSAKLGIFLLSDENHRCSFYYRTVIEERHMNHNLYTKKYAGFLHLGREIPVCIE